MTGQWRVPVVGTRRCKIGTQIREDSFPRMTWIRGSRYPRVFSRIYPWVPAIDPDSCSALNNVCILLVEAKLLSSDCGACLQYFACFLTKLQLPLSITTALPPVFRSYQIDTFLWFSSHLEYPTDQVFKLTFFQLTIMSTLTYSTQWFNFALSVSKSWHKDVYKYHLI